MYSIEPQELFLNSISQGLPLDSAMFKLIKDREEEHSIKSAQAEIKVNELTAENRFLREQIRLLKHKMFGSKSEILPTEQLALGVFNEAEVTIVKEEEVEVKGHKKRKAKKKQIPDDIERRQTIIDLTDEEKKCLHDGAHLVLKEEKVYEKLEIIPAQTYVNEVIVRKYECSFCDEQYAPVNNELGILPNTLAAPSLLSYLVVSKYCDALPLYRISQILAREEIHISRQTMARWIVELALKTQVLINLLRDLLFESGYIRMDETTIQVLNEEGRSAQSKSYMWVQCGEYQNEKIILFDYRPTRSSAVPVELLAGFSGYLQTDAYVGYDAVERNNKNIIRLGCWDHCRRHFFEAHQLADGQGITNDFLYLTKKLYKIEEQIAGKIPEEIKEVRQHEAVPVLQEFKKLAMAQRDVVPLKTKLSQAINYALQEWQHLTEYVKDGRLKISNELAENSIRPFAVGRKNWLFADTPDGADASAILYTLGINAIKNGLPPGPYFKHVFHQLPLCKTLDDFQKLLPLKAFFKPPPPE